MIYPILKKTLFCLPPEPAHHLGLMGIRTAFKTPILKTILTKQFRYENPMLQQNIMGLTFKNPVGLAAGFDKYCTFFQHFENLGFGFGEVGTITPLPQNGNEKPRLFRDPPHQAILNRMGFNNGGMQNCAEKMQKNPTRSIPIAINIGKNKVTPNEEAKSDYVKLVTHLSDDASFFVVNISSPNTPGLRNLQAKEDLQRLLEPIVEENQKRKNLPIALKIAPDITQAELDDIIFVVLQTGLSCLITTNTTIDKSKLSPPFQQEQGGASGLPVKEKSNQVLQWAAQRIEKKIPIIGVGGIFSAQDAYRKIKLGASLIEVFTGWIYQGPSLISQINQGLVELLQKDGYTHIQQAIGKETYDH